MFTLHIANKNYSSWSLRPWVLMKALDIPFLEEVHPLQEGTSWSTYRDFSPSGTVPALHTEGQVVWDSMAIAEFLAERYPAVWPADPAARAWARCAAAEMHSSMSALRNQCGMSVGIRVKLRDYSAALEKDVKRVDELWSQGLERFGGPFLAGQAFTAVDAFFAPVAYRVRTYDLPLSPIAKDYAERLVAHPAMLEWEGAALAETWRESSHEQDFRDAGEITADFRAS